MPRIALIGIPAVLAVAIVAAGGWYFFLRGDAPPPVSLAEAIATSGAAIAPAPATASTGVGGPAVDAPVGLTQSATQPRTGRRWLARRYLGGGRRILVRGLSHRRGAVDRR